MATQKVELGPDGHEALQQLEAVSLPLVLSAAPGKVKAGTNGNPVLIEADGEALDHSHAAGPGVGKPSIEGSDDAGLGLRAVAAAALDPVKPRSERDAPGRLLILQHPRDRGCGLGDGVETFRLTQEMPG